MAEIAIFDAAGNPRSWEWLAGIFGDILIRRGPSGPGWRIAELRERTGPAALIVTLRKEGEPAAGIHVARAWGPDIAEGVLDPSLPALPDEVATWFDRGVWGPTEASGSIGFGMGGGDAYLPDVNGRGASAVWPEGPSSDQVLGLGWIAFTEHRTIESVFVWSDEDPGPGDDLYTRAALALEAIGAGFEALGSVVRDLAE